MKRFVLEKTRENTATFKDLSGETIEPLQDSIEVAEQQPELIFHKFYQYYAIIKDLFNLTPEEIDIIKRVNEEFNWNRGADRFLEVFGDQKDTVLTQIRQIGDLDNSHNQSGLSRLTDMMKNAWTIKQANPNWQPTDGDPQSDDVIWGFTRNATTPDIDLDFTICHGIERILTTYYSEIALVQHKDWLLSALNDVIALKGLRQQGYEAELLPMWSTPRPGGLGWINQTRMDKFREILDIH